MSHVYSIDSKGISEFKEAIGFAQTGTIKELVSESMITNVLSYTNVKQSIVSILNTPWDITELPPARTWFVQGYMHVLGTLRYIVILTLSTEGHREVYSAVSNTKLNVTKYLYGTCDLISLQMDEHLTLKHTFNYGDKYEIRGKMLGYPDCCIESFITESRCFETLRNRKPRKLDGDGYLPCVACNNKYSADELIEKINANRHPSFKPFPDNT